MQRGRNRRLLSGFTAIEMILVVAIVGIMAAIVVPNLLRTIHRAKLEGITRETAALMQRARSEAVRQNVSTVVRPDLARNEVFAFADVDGVALGDPPDSIFNPVAGQPHRATDYEIGRFMLPSNILFEAPASDPDPVPISGFSTVGPDQVAIFDPDGSIRALGAVRYSDRRGNFLEVRVAPAATGRTQVRKWDQNLVDWQTRRQNDKPWVWY